MKKLNKRLNILVTAGATREPIDPVRFISNCSTGFFGCEITREAKRRGHQVILISGQTAFAKPKNVRSIEVCTAAQMKKELESRFSWCDCLIMTAAICDFRAKRVAKNKIKKGKKKELILTLTQNSDILKSLSRQKDNKMLVGFALETENLKKNAEDKLREKNLDLIVATLIKPDNYPFGRVSLDVLIIDKKGHLQQVRQTTKTRLARILLDKIENLIIDGQRATEFR